MAKGYRARRNFLVYELLSMVTDQTPKKTGLATGNWQISVGARNGSVLDRKDLGGGETVTEEITKLRGASAFATIHVFNNLHYISDLENGTSGQAPHGILRVVVPAFRAMNSDAI